MNEEVQKLAYAAYKCKKSSEFFTKYMFKKRELKKFIVGKHHKQIWELVDKILNGEVKRAIINISPRYGKTELLVKQLIAQGLAINPRSKFIHLSYSDDLALDNSNTVREMVQQDFYKELFPEVQLKADSNSKKKWYTTKGGGVYATSTGGQVTGFGAGEIESEDFYDSMENMEEKIFSGALIIDDPIKPEDADSDLLRERINQRFNSTLKNRVNSRNTPIIIIMQRLHERDLTGFLIEQGIYSEENPEGWHVLSLPVITEEGEPLWEHMHTMIELEEMRRLDPFTFERQYMQSPQPLEGRMYQPFQEYETLPITKMARRKNYTDVADKGKDYLCSMCYVQTEIGNYVTDVVYTKSSTVTTEPMVVNMLNRNRTERARIESNNGGSIFARNVRNQLRTTGNHTCFVEEFTQSKNKESRILNNRAEVNNMIIFPKGWQHKWPELYQHITSFRAEGKNEYDDAPDVLTGIAESSTKGSGLISVFTARTNDYHNN